MLAQNYYASAYSKQDNYYASRLIPQISRQADALVKCIKANSTLSPTILASSQDQKRTTTFTTKSYQLLSRVLSIREYTQKATQNLRYLQIIKTQLTSQLLKYSTNARLDSQRSQDNTSLRSCIHLEKTTAEQTL